MMLKNSFDLVSDPSDWSKTLFPQLSDLDSLLRCHICKEFIKAPVLTSCDHAFCSICIRRSLSSNNKCPLCLEDCYESTLRKILLIDEISHWFIKNRGDLLDFVTTKDNSQKLVRDTQKVDNYRTVEGKGKDNNNENDNDYDDLEIIEVKENRLKRSRTTTPTYESKKKSKQTTATSSFETTNSDDFLVECPVCSSFMTAEELQTSHLDRCLNGEITEQKHTTRLKSNLRSKSKSSTGTISSFFSPRGKTPSNNHSQSHSHLHSHSKKKLQPQIQPESIKVIQRLPNLDSSISISKLKEKLNQFELSTNGTRTQLEIRMKEFINLFNANLDSITPVNEKVLKSRLIQWENLQNNKKPFKNEESLDRDDEQKEEKKEWNEKYKSEYKRLIATAKKNVKKKEQKEQKEQKEATSGVEGDGVIEKEKEEDLHTEDEKKLKLEEKTTKLNQKLTSSLFVGADDNNSEFSFSEDETQNSVQQEKKFKDEPLFVDN